MAPPSGPEGPGLHPPAPASSPRDAGPGDMVHVLLRDLPGEAKEWSKGGRKQGPQTLQRLRDSQHVNSPNMPLFFSHLLAVELLLIQQIVLRIYSVPSTVLGTGGA